MYKITSDLLAIPAADYLIPNTRQSRHNHQLAYRQIQTLKDFFKLTLFPRTIVHWNGLEPLHERKRQNRNGSKKGSHDYSSVTEMMSNLGWRSLENRRYGARLLEMSAEQILSRINIEVEVLMFYKIVYGLVVIPIPSYFERPEVYTHHPHPLAYIQIYTSVVFPPACFSMVAHHAFFFWRHALFLKEHTKSYILVKMP